jgi:hypothetical protein
MKDVGQQFRIARNRGVPLLALNTPDPAATMQRLAGALNGSAETTPLLHWDLVRGITAVESSAAGRQATAMIDRPETITNPAEALTCALDLPQESILFCETLDACWSEAGASGAAVQQAVRNLRDAFKASEEGRRARQLVVLSPAVTLPPLLQNDVLVLEEDLPSREELGAIIRDLHRTTYSSEPDEGTLDSATDAIAGLSAFPAEQAVALSLRPDGIDIGALAERKRQMINQTPGLEVRQEQTTFADLAGLHEIKRVLSRLADLRAFDCVLWVDEIEKAMAGSFSANAGDSGVGRDFLAQILTWMQDRMNRDGIIGMLLMGVPGSGKSAICQATGNSAGRPLIRMDPGAMRGQYVGQSEGLVRQALKVVDAVSQRRVLLLATCNSAAGMDSALLSRFVRQYYFDLPDADENAGLWAIYRRTFGIPEGEPNPPSLGWTGREVRACCESARLFGESLADSARAIVPVCRAAFDEVLALRRQAAAGMLSATHGGTWTNAMAVDVTKQTYLSESAPARRIILD